jgi:predicted Rdx family selenoprotein
MEKKRCHCNGSRGTDCDWCQGSGWVTKKISLTIGKSKGKIEVEPIMIRKEFEIKNNVAVEVKKNDSQTSKKKKTFDARIAELKRELKHSDEDLLDESISYLKKRIDILVEDLKRVEKRVTKKQRRHFDKIMKQAEEIKAIFLKKFNPLEKRINTSKKELEFEAKSKNNLHKSPQTHPTLYSKFAQLFDKLKNNLKT